jgi:hypothetical protein
MNGKASEITFHLGRMKWGDILDTRIMGGFDIKTKKKEPNGLE